MKTAIFWEQESWGGVDTHLLTLLKYWEKNEDELVLFSNINNLGLERIHNDLLKLPNLSIVKYHSIFFNKSKYSFFNKLKSLLRPLVFVMSVYKYKKLLESHHFDAILSENGGYPGSWGCLAIIFSAKMCRITKRVLLIHHEATRPAYYQKYFENFIDNMIGSISTDVIAVSLATRDSLYKHRYLLTNKAPIRVIYNGVDFSDFSSAKYNLKVEHNIEDKKKLIGVVGRVERYKGHEDIIFANSLLNHTEQDNIQLIFIGKGDQSEINRLNRLQNSLEIKKPFIHTGYLNDESRAIIEQLDVLCVLTKDFEGFGLTIAEAMSCGIPVLATKVGAVTEFVSNDFATLIDPESPHQISDFLVNFLENEELYRKKAQIAQKHIQKFSPERMVNHFKAIMREL
jgi:glycosyltransferase involved in cell wall biosynthesis